MKIAQPSTILVYLPVYLALENSKHEMVSYGTAAKALEAVGKGEADIAIGDPFMFKYVDYKKYDLVIIAACIRKVLHSLLTFSPFLRTANEKELAGKTLVTYPEPSTSFFLGKMLKEQYKVGTLLQTPFNTELGPLLTEEAELAIVLEPNATYAKQNGAHELIDFGEIHAVTTGLCMKKQTYAKKKQEVENLLASIKKGFEMFETDHEKTLALARRYFPLVHESVLREALSKLREKEMYCKDFLFTEEEIKRGLELRDLQMSTKEVKKFFIKTAL